MEKENANGKQLKNKQKKKNPGKEVGRATEFSTKFSFIHFKKQTDLCSELKIIRKKESTIKNNTRKHYHSV